MSDIQQDPLTARIGRATERLAQLQARQKLKQMRLAAAARTRERKLVARRRFELGEALDLAGFGDWEATDLVGLVLAAKDHFGDAETARKLMRQRAGQAVQLLPTP